MKKQHVISIAFAMIGFILLILVVLTTFSDVVKVLMSISAIVSCALALVFLYRKPKKEPDYDILFNIVLIRGTIASPDGITAVPEGDALDFLNGARYIPSEVTDARRNGQKVVFHMVLGEKNWYWKMPDGTKVPY